MRKVLILGGCGRTGREIAQLLADAGGYENIIASQTIHKAQDFVRKLQTQHPDEKFTATSTDISDKKQLVDIVINTQLVIICVPLDHDSTCNLIEAILQTEQTHYIDLSPADDKQRAFAENSYRIHNGKHVSILNAGFEPGLPRLLAKLLLSAIDKPASLEMAGLYRDPDIPAGGIKDILAHDTNAKIFESGGWRESSLSDAKRISFPNNFGTALSIPIWEAELESIPKKYHLNRLMYYHAGVNGLANLVMITWPTALKIILSEKTGISLYRRAIKYFTKRPYGCIIKARATGSSGAKEGVVSHTDLYKATAIPVVVTAQMLLQKSSPKTGVYFMGTWADHDLFIQKAEKLGLEIKINIIK